MVFLLIPLHDGLCWCVILQAMDHEVLKEMEKALARNKTLETLTLADGGVVSLPKEFCRHVLLGTRQNTSLSDVHLDFFLTTWDCPDDGIGWCMSVILCDSVGCSAYCAQLDVWQ